MKLKLICSDVAPEHCQLRAIASPQHPHNHATKQPTQTKQQVSAIDTCVREPEGRAKCATVVGANFED